MEVIIVARISNYAINMIIRYIDCHEVEFIFFFWMVGACHLYDMAGIARFNV